MRRSLMHTLAALLLLAAAPGWAQILTWTAPVLNTDGTPLTNLAGYRIKYGTSASALDQSVTLSNPALTTYSLDGLAPGTWYVGLTAYTSSAESALSGIVSMTLAAPPPICPTKPADLTRAGTCPVGTTGAFTQTLGTTLAVAPACWTADPDWLPLSAPAGSCTLIPPISVALAANPVTITVGASSTLTWGSANAQSCSGVDTALNGSLIVTPTVTTTYTQSCSDAAGMTVNASATVTVTPLPPPVCPAKPADVTRLAMCPTGTTGTFTQSKGWTCVSGVWIAAATWAPLTPPAGSCPIAPTSSWKVAASFALPVYEAVLPASGSIIVRGAQVGTIAVGKPCGAQLFTEGGRSFRAVTASDVQLASPTYATRTLVAACVYQ